MRITAAFAVVLASLPAVALAVDNVTVARSDDDLIIRWGPVTPAPDGYRVYRSSSYLCRSYDLVTATTRTEHTEPGVLADVGFAVYRVAAFIGAVEAPASAPIYKYGVPTPNIPGAIGGSMATLPYVPTFADLQTLCDDLSGVGSQEPIAATGWWEEASTSVFELACERVPVTIPIAPGDAVYLKPHPDLTSATPVLWGVGAAWQLEFPSVAIDVGFPFPPINAYAVSLPYDHVYRDLREVGDEVPNAVFVGLFDPGAAAADPQVRGIRRDDSSAAWTGSNFRLDAPRGHAVFIGVDVAPTGWVPRQHCAGAITVDLTGVLKAVKNGADADLDWDAGPAAAFDVYKLDDKRQLADLMSQPVELTTAAPPALPVTVVTGTPDRSLFYNVLGR